MGKNLLSLPDNKLKNVYFKKIGLLRDPQDDYVLNQISQYYFYFKDGKIMNKKKSEMKNKLFIENNGASQKNSIHNFENSRENPSFIQPLLPKNYIRIVNQISGKNSHMKSFKMPGILEQKPKIVEPILLSKSEEIDLENLLA